LNEPSTSAADQRTEGVQSSSPVDLCAFWALHEKQHPSLARMAFDILSIPAMSAECERVLVLQKFFCVREAISDERRCNRGFRVLKSMAAGWEMYTFLE
jgi:hypothetical protein